MSAKDVFEETATKVRGPWVLSGTLVLLGLYLVKLTYPEVHAGSLTEHLRRTNAFVELVFPIAGVLLAGAGIMVGVRQQNVDTKKLRDDTTKQEVQQLRSEIQSLREELRGTQGKIRALTLLAIKGNEESAFIGYLDSIVKICKDSSDPSQKYEFWVKIYEARPDRSLKAKYKSNGAPRSVGDHHLRPGVGGAGKFLESFTEKPILQPEYYAWADIQAGHDADTIAELDRRGVRSVLCAPIVGQRALVAADGRISFRPVTKEGKSRLYGVMCFCSTRGEKETSLQSDERKKRACQYAANLAGSMFHQHRVVSGIEISALS